MNLSIYYDLIWGKIINYREDLNKILPILRKYNVKTILEIGCGTGNYLVDLAKKGFYVDGIDVDKSSLKILKKKISENISYRIKLINKDFYSFNPDKEYDCVLILGNTFPFLVINQKDLQRLTYFLKRFCSKLFVFDVFTKKIKKEKINMFEFFNNLNSKLLLLISKFRLINDKERIFLWEPNILEISKKKVKILCDKLIFKEWNIDLLIKYFERNGFTLIYSTNISCNRKILFFEV